MPDPVATATRPQLIKLADVPAVVAWLPRGRRGKPISYFTLNTWAQEGLRGKKLRTVPVGGALCTCEDWLWEFFESLRSDPPAPNDPTPRQQQKNHDRAVAALAASGV